MNMSLATDESKTTITDVARLAEVSIKTVSRVVNEEANVRETTRLRVQEVIDRLGYRPNPYAQYMGQLRRR